MSKISFHKCRICGAIFYHFNKNTYCPKCVAPYKSGENRSKIINDAIENRDIIEARRARWRAYWHKKMESPEFREKERLRSLARARANRKYLVKEDYETTK